jgi:phage shock protein E
MSHISRRLAAFGLAGVLALAACGGDDDPVADPTTETDEATGAADDAAGAAVDVDYGLVDPTTAAELADDPEVTVIDVRTPEEYAQGHIEGSTMINFEGPDFADQITQLDPDQEYLVYCRSGNRSRQAVAMLADIGVDRVYDLDGGIGSWQAAGLPLVR